MMGLRRSTRQKTRRKLTPDQVRFNRTSARFKGKPGSKPYKRYIFGHMTNVRKGRV